MKSSELKTGVLYSIGYDGRKGYIIDPQRRYHPSHGKSPIGDTHVMALVAQGARPEIIQRGETYTLEDFHEGVGTPIGFRVELLTPGQIVGTHADAVERIAARNADLYEQSRSESSRHVERARNVVLALSEAGINVKLGDVHYDSISLSYDQVQQLIDSGK